MMFVFLMTVVLVNVQRGYGYGHHYERNCRVAYYLQPRCNYNNNYRRPLIDVVIVPRARIIVNPQP